MGPPDSANITALLKEVNEERPGAWDRLMATAYDELRAGCRTGDAPTRPSRRPGSHASTHRPGARGVPEARQGGARIREARPLLRGFQHVHDAGAARPHSFAKGREARRWLDARAT